jgi:hypothetical protein
MDIEGYELNARRGARKELGTAPRDCFVEVHAGVGLESYGRTVEEVLSFFFPKINMSLWYETTRLRTSCR